MIKSIIILFALQLVSSLIFPWWSIAVVAFLYFFLTNDHTIAKSIVISFTSSFILYLVFSLYQDLQVEVTAASFIADILGGLPAWLTYIIASIVGGIVSAFGGLTGQLFIKTFSKK